MFSVRGVTISRPIGVNSGFTNGPTSRVQLGPVTASASDPVGAERRDIGGEPAPSSPENFAQKQTHSIGGITADHLGKQKQESRKRISPPMPLRQATKTAGGCRRRRYACSVAMRVRPVCVPDVAVDGRVPGRTRHHSERAARHRRVLNMTAMISAAITAFFGIQGLFIGQDWWVSPSTSAARPSS